MASHPLLDFIRRLRRARSVAEGGHLTDAQLLERFVKQRDEAAFEVLVWRHGTLVLNVARRLLRQTADAEDVFQATFLTLARKAAAIRRGTSVSSWLYKVAYRIAVRVRQAAARRERRQPSALENAAAPVEHGDAEMDAVLAEEVNRLPERYRAVVVLCYLQGATTEEASRLLGCPRGTVLSRLASARQRLRQRLVRRGIAPAIALAAVSFGEAALAAPSVALVVCVVRAALPFAAGGAAVPMISPQAAALAQGALQTMLWSKIKIVAVMACMITLVGTGSGWLARSRNAVETSLPAAEPQAPKVGPLPEAAKDNMKEEIAKIRDAMSILAAREEKEENELSEAAIEARLRLLDVQQALKVEEKMLEFDRELPRIQLKVVLSEIMPLEKTIVDQAPKGPSVALEAAQRRRNELIEQKNKIESEEFKILRHFQQREAMLNREMIKAEEKLRRIETLRRRHHEDFLAQREIMQARIPMLEEKALGVEPADRLREMERKLDALRRDVGELRRSVERQKDLPKKPE